MLEQGTKIVAGVTLGKAGQKAHNVLVYDTIEEALSEHEVDASILFVPANVALDSCFEAIDAGVKVIVLITEHVPVHDTMRIRVYAKRNGMTVIGPTTPGIISPGKTKIGIMPIFVFPGSGRRDFQKWNAYLRVRHRPARSWVGPKHRHRYGG